MHTPRTEKSQPTRSGERGLQAIGVVKLFTSLALVASAFGLFRLMHADVGKAIEHFALRVHLDPDSRITKFLVSKVGGLKRTDFEIIALGAFLSGLLEIVEGIGLIFKKTWASYLTVVATALLLPVEIYEITQKVNPVRIGVFVVNIAILVYLIVNLIKERRLIRD